MRAILIIGTASLCAAQLGCALMPDAQADRTPRQRLGEHPAVVTQRLYRSAGYDYASKFYPHPAWLYLHAASPSDMSVEAAMTGEALDVDPDPVLHARRQEIRPDR